MNASKPEYIEQMIKTITRKESDMNELALCAMLIICLIAFLGSIIAVKKLIKTFKNNWMNTIKNAKGRNK